MPSLNQSPRSRQVSGRCIARTAGGRPCKAHSEGDLPVCAAHGTHLVKRYGRISSYTRRRFGIPATAAAAVEAAVRSETADRRTRRDRRRRVPQHGGYSFRDFYSAYRRIVAALPGGNRPTPAEIEIRHRVHDALEEALHDLPARLVPPSHPAVEEALQQALAATATRPASARGRVLPFEVAS